jgi:hypothetical protein
MYLVFNVFYFDDMNILQMFHLALQHSRHLQKREALPKVQNLHLQNVHKVLVHNRCLNDPSQNHLPQNDPHKFSRIQCFEPHLFCKHPFKVGFGEHFWEI